MTIDELKEILLKSAEDHNFVHSNKYNTVIDGLYKTKELEKLLNEYTKEKK